MKNSMKLKKLAAVLAFVLAVSLPTGCAVNDSEQDFAGKEAQAAAEAGAPGLKEESPVSEAETGGGRPVLNG